MTTKNTDSPYAMLPAPPLHRRMIAMLYDFAVASTGILIIASVLVSFISLISPQKDILPSSPLANVLFAFYLLLGALYFVIFWLKKDYTLGMSVWKLRISDMAGNKITPTQAIIRYFSVIAIMALGFIMGDQLLHLGSGSSLLMSILFFGLSLMWSLFNPNKLALHEQLSRTKLIDIRFNKLSDPPNEIQ
jgi:uncharacterized RDD family membrane protein YckC